VLRRLVGFDGVARREQYSVTRRRGAQLLLHGISISGRLAPCACNQRQDASNVCQIWPTPISVRGGCGSA